MVFARWTQAAIAGFLLMGGLSACDGGPTTPSGFFQALISGSVVTPAGDEVQAARLTIWPFRDHCDGRRVGRIVVLSSETGRYEKEITADTPEPLSCLKIEVEAPPESGLRDTTFTVMPVDLALREEPPFDSLRVDVTLPAP